LRADLNRLFLDLHQHVSADRQAEFWQTFPRPWSYLEKSVAAGMTAGDIASGDPVIIARVCYSAFVGQMQIARFHNSIPYPNAALAEEIVDMLLNGLRPR
jgi:hypothetical protein